MPKTEHKNALNCVYLFTCCCGLRYIGECENLRNRCIDHQQPSKSTAIHSHTAVCEQFKSKFDNFSRIDNFENRFAFLREKFQVLHSNLEYRTRIQFEALEIRLRGPQLNKQVKHKSLQII